MVASAALLGSVWVLAVGVAVAQTEVAVPTEVTVSTYSTDLMQLYREARLEDPHVIASYAQAKAGTEHQREAMGALLPQLSFNAGSNRIHQESDLVQRSFDSELRPGVAPIPLQQGRLGELSKIQEPGPAVRIASAGHPGRSLRRTGAALFHRVGRRGRIGTGEGGASHHAEEPDRVNALYEKQLALITDQLDLKARVDLLSAQELDARNQASLSREALAEIVGRPVKERLNRVRGDRQLQVSAQSLESWVRDGIALNPALKANESGVEAAGAALRSGKGGHYPTLSLNLSAQQTNEGYNNSLAPAPTATSRESAYKCRCTAADRPRRGSVGCMRIRWSPSSRWKPCGGGWSRKSPVPT